MCCVPMNVFWTILFFTYHSPCSSITRCNRITDPREARSMIVDSWQACSSLSCHFKLSQRIFIDTVLSATGKSVKEKTKMESCATQTTTTVRRLTINWNALAAQLLGRTIYGHHECQHIPDGLLVTKHLRRVQTELQCVPFYTGCGLSGVTL